MAFVMQRMRALKGISALFVAVGFFVSGCIWTPSGHSGTTDFYLEDFGALGDGVSDDSASLKTAMDAVRNSGTSCRLLFSPGKTYRLGLQNFSDAQFDFSGMENIEVDGRGATLIVHPVHGIARFFNSRNIVFRNFVIQHDPLPFTQGTIVSVDADAGRFRLRIHDGFPLPPSEEWIQEQGHFFDNPAAVLPQREEWADRAGGKSLWRWGVIMEPDSPALKKDFVDHLFVQTIVPVGPEGERTFDVVVLPTYQEFLSAVVPGDRFVYPRFRRDRDRYFKFRDQGWMFEQNVQIRESSDITVENLTFYTARPGMVFGVRHNEGPVVIRGCTVTWLPGSENLIASWKDGVHCKNNRVGPIIENCRFEGLLDDSINMSADAVMAEQIFSGSSFVMTSRIFDEGDAVGVFFPDTGCWQTDYRVESVQGQTVCLNHPVPHVFSGSMVSGKDCAATQFYNLSRANADFEIRNCCFGIQRRHAMLVRCQGSIEGNVVNGVGGSAVLLANETGSFYEGPFPCNKIVQNNRIEHTRQCPVVVKTCCASSSSVPVVENVLLKNNVFQSDMSTLVELKNVKNVRVESNIFLNADQTVRSAEGSVSIAGGCRDIHVE